VLVAATIAGVSFQMMSWYGSFVYLVIGMVASCFFGIVTAGIASVLIWPEPRRAQSVFIFLNLIAVVYAVLALAPPER